MMTKVELVQEIIEVKKRLNNLKNLKNFGELNWYLIKLEIKLEKNWVRKEAQCRK